MRRLAALAALLFLAGCASLPQPDSWEKLAAGAAVADVATTQAALSAGGTEANPLYGQRPQVGTMVAVNVGLFLVIHAALKDLPSAERRRAWRAFAVFRFACVAWTLSRR